MVAKKLSEMEKNFEVKRRDKKNAEKNKETQTTIKIYNIKQKKTQVSKKKT